MSWRRRTGVDGVGRRPWLWGPGLGRVPIKRRAGCSGPCARLMHSHPSPSDIQTHLYNSFLHASTYDVALRVSGSWNAIYKLHRVVLIQSVSIMAHAHRPLAADMCHRDSFDPSSQLAFPSPPSGMSTCAAAQMK